MQPVVVVIGASLGGLDALKKLLPHLPEDFPAAILVVIHTGQEGGGESLTQRLQQVSKLEVSVAFDRERFHPGQVYLPPSDHHILVQNDRIRISRGPRENNFRPAIDPLFRSAAFYGRTGCVGVLLSGLLDDGASGLLSIHECGGKTIVQDTHEATYSEMPENAIRLHPPDHVASLKKMGPVLEAEVRFAARHQAESPPAEKLSDGVRLTERAMQIEDQALRGHSTDSECTVEELLAEQDPSLEEALWAAVRSLEEKRKTLERLAAPKIYGGRTQETQKFVQRINHFLMRIADRAGPRD